MFCLYRCWNKAVWSMYNMIYEIKSEYPGMLYNIIFHINTFSKTVPQLMICISWHIYHSIMTKPKRSAIQNMQKMALLRRRFQHSRVLGDSSKLPTVNHRACNFIFHILHKYTWVKLQNERLLYGNSFQ